MDLNFKTKNVSYLCAKVIEIIGKLCYNFTNMHPELIYDLYADTYYRESDIKAYAGEIPGAY